MFFIKKKNWLPNNYYRLLYQCIIANKSFFFCRSNINHIRKSGLEQPRPSCIGITVPTWQPHIDYGCSVPTTIIAHTIFPFTPYSLPRNNKCCWILSYHTSKNAKHHHLSMSKLLQVFQHPKVIEVAHHLLSGEAFRWRRHKQKWQPFTFKINRRK